MKIKSLIAAGIFSLFFLASAQENLKTESRGFGKIDARLQRYPNGAGVTFFTMENPEKAVLTASKRKADLLGFGDLKELTDGKNTETLLQLKNTGYWLLGTRGNLFIEIFAKDLPQLRKIAASNGKLNPVPNRKYPRYLDGFDRSGPAFWVGGGGDNYVLPDDFEWMKKRNFAFCTLNPTQSRLVAPGIIDDSIFRYHVTMAKKYDLAYRQLLFPTVFEWNWNLKPLPYIHPVKNFIGNPYLHYTTQTVAGGEEPVKETDPLRWDLRRRLVKTIGTDENLIGWHGCTEIPTANINFLAGLAETPHIRQLYINYLKNHLKLSLKEAGLRYHGNPAYYKSWNDVNVPVPTDFLGYNPKTALKLNGDWEVRPDQKSIGRREEWFKEEKAPAGWVNANCSDPMILMYQWNRHQKQKEKRSFWMRKKMTLPAGKKTEAFRYLHIAQSRYHGSATTPFDVWVNGKSCKPVSDSGEFSFCYDLKDALKNGVNSLVLETHGEPVPGYIFLNDVPMRQYPNMTERENQAWFDAIQFAAYLRVKKIEDDLKSIRFADPARPLKMMATIDLLDLTTPLAQKYGAYQHDTGGAGGYWCPMSGARLARAHGFAWSCEQGGPPKNAEAFQSQVSFYLMYGNDAVDFVFGVGHYTKKPDVAAWVDQNLELLHCIGKMTLPKQKIALLRSSRNSRMGFKEPWNWDIGRGMLQSVGRNFVYLELPDLFRPEIVNRYPVIMDAGTIQLTEAESKAIRRYVENGGIFIAQHHTGRHSASKADSWPLPAEFGLTVKDKAISKENYHRWPLLPITFDGKQTLLPSLKGKTVEGCGVAIDYLKNNHTGAVKLNGKNANAIARWKDGDIAVAEVSAGKGRFLFIGAPFFYRMKDVNGVWLNDEGRSALLDEMLTSLNVPRETKTENRSIWTEIWESKNGVYDLYPVIRMEKQGAKVKTSAPEIQRKDKIDRIVEVSSLNHPEHPVAWSNGTFQLPKSDYTPMQTRIFIAPTSDVGSSAMRWIRNQSQIWHKVDEVKEQIPEPAMDPNVIALKDGWKVSDEFTQESAFFKPEFNSASWKNVTAGTFASMGYPENAKLLLRREITLPSQWKGHKVTLTFDANHWFWGLTPHCRFWINGVPADLRQPIRPMPNAAFTIDVTPQAKSGKIVLALSIDGTQMQNQNKKQAIPHGISGIFYLRRYENPVAEIPLNGPWFACPEFGEKIPVKFGEKKEHVYFETSFKLPKKLPGTRIFLKTGKHLGGLIINGRPIDTPSWMNELDITGLVNSSSENRLYWIPQGLNRSPLCESKNTSPMPELSLLFYR